MNEIQNVVTVGAGKMPRGIAPVCAHAGYNVTMVDLKEEVLQEAVDVVKSTLDFLVDNQFVTEQEAKSALSRISGSTDIDKTLKDADFVIESVPENLALKKQVFHQMDKVCREHAILSTNTSSLRISDIADATTRPHNVMGFHWVNPPYLIPVIEIIRGQKTSESTVNKAKDLAIKMDKIPVVCRDVPGFLINRLQLSLVGEAISLLEEGAASVEDIDNAMRLGIGIRYALWGPLKCSDFFGNKRQALTIFEYLKKETGSDRFCPSNLLRQKVELGELGLVSGKGWYDFTKQSPSAVIRERDEQLAKIVKFLRDEGLLQYS